MRTLAKFAPAVLWAFLFPSTAFAQASLTGVVRDSSGAVLPGVTVEAASPVLIEKVRTAVTDGSGRYQLIDLRPGAYTVTFTLAGFNASRREGVTLSGSAASVVDSELRVGSLEETITVTGDAPTVDVSTTSRQAVLSADTIDALPSARNYVTLARMIPSAVYNGTDVGGSNLQLVGGSVRIHGSRDQDQRVTLNGINTMTLQAGGNIGGQIPDVGSASEVTVDHTAVSAELPTGGVRINFIPRDGGNKFAAATFFTFSNGALASDNFTDELKAAGLGAPNEIKKNWDLNASSAALSSATRSGTGSRCVTPASKTGRRSSRTSMLTSRRSSVRAGHDTRAPRGTFLQQQSSHHVAGDATQQDRRHVQTGHMVRLSERD